jgi:hypothetical protein
MAEEAEEDAEEEQQLVFKMINGDEYTRTFAGGEEVQALRTLLRHFEEWIEVDDSIHIRTAHVVSVQLRPVPVPLVS